MSICLCGRRPLHRLAFAALLAGSALMPNAVSAQSWTGATSTDWQTGTNWSTGNAPTSATDADVTASVSNQPVLQGGNGAARNLLIGNLIGSAFPAALALRGGAQLGVGQTINVGLAAGTVGTLTVDSATLSGPTLTVGGGGSGSLIAQNGAQVTTNSLLLGDIDMSTGALFADGAGTQIGAVQLIVGNLGQGSVTLTGGAMLQAQGATIGSLGTGSVGISGPGSALNVQQTLIIGDAGAADVTIGNGGAISANLVQLGNAAGTGGTLRIDGPGSIATFGTAVAGIAGRGDITVSNGGTLEVTGGLVIGQDLSGRGTLYIGSDTATPGVPGTIIAPQISFPNGAGSIILNHTSTAYDLSVPLVGLGNIALFAGTTTLSADSSAFTGVIGVLSGVINPSDATLILTGKLGGNLAVAGDGSRFEGSGSMSGRVVVGANGHLVGQTGQTLTMGQLDLDNTAQVDVTLGAPGSAVLFDITGNLTLDGTLNIAAAPGFGSGLYRLFDYGGTLTDNGLDVGTTPRSSDGQYVVQTSVPGQIGLVFTGSGPVDFWDGDAPGTAANGVVDGGAGTWSAVSTNFTDASGATSGAMAPQPGMAIFAGRGGAVAVDTNAGPIAVTGLQFAVDGYVLRGGAITLSDPSTAIRVGDGSVGGAVFTATIASALVGSGGLDKTDRGTLILTGANTYSGGTRVSGGTLVGNATSLQGDITDNGALVFDQAAGGTYAGSLSGTGNLTKAGAGRLILAGDSSAFSGSTMVAAGLLSINGSLAGSAVTVANGATLGGTGTIGRLTVQTGGTIAPGNSIGTLAVAGNVTLQNGAIYRAEVDPATGTSDRIAATGSASLTGTVDIIAPTALRYGQSFRIVTAAQGISGTFGAVTMNGQALVVGPFQLVGLSYGANAVDLALDVNRPALAAAGLTPNERAVAGAASQLPGSSTILTALANGSVAQAVAAFDQLSGEIHAAVPRLAFEDSRIVRDFILAQAGQGKGRGGWLLLAGNWGATPTDGNYARSTRANRVVIGGVDLPLGSDGRIGVAVGHGNSHVALDGRPGRADEHMLHVATYAAGRLGGVSLRGGLSFGDGRVSTRRTATVGSVADTDTARTKLHSVQAFGEASFALSAGPAKIEPFANLAAIGIRTGSFAEQGGATALTGTARSHDIQLTTVGLRVARDGAFGIGATLGWRHAFGDIRPAAQFALSGAPSFTILGPEVGHDAALAEAKATLRLSRTVRVEAGYSGAFGHGHDHGARAALRIGI